MKRMMKKALTIILALLIITACGIGLADSNDEYMRITRLETAYYEPIEEPEYCAGKFACNSIVKILQRMSDDWVQIEYRYDPEVYISLGLEESAYDESANRSVYVRSSSLFPIMGNSAEIENNAILNEEQIRVVAMQPSEFNEDLLVNMQYVPRKNEDIEMTAEFTNRTKTVGNEANFKDALTMQTKQPYVGNNRMIYTPMVRLGNEIQYPADQKAMNAITSQNLLYYINNELITDQKVLAGLRFILENSPPYKVYTSYPSDYEEASRTAASLAIRAYLKDTTGNADWLDVFNGITAYDKNEFNNDYMDYMYWLYYGAVKVYSTYTDNDSLFISADLQGAPTEKDGIYSVSVRITTNATNGWKIEKSSLDENIISISNATETENEYIGDNGTQIITINTTEEVQGQTLSIPILYNSDDSIIQISVPEDTENPILISLSRQDKNNPPKNLQIKYPDASTVAFNAFIKETSSPVENVSIEMTSGNGRIYRTTTDEKGKAEILCPPGKYVYTLINSPSGLTAESSVEINAENSVDVDIEFEKKTYDVSLRIENAVTHELIYQSANVKIFSETDAETPVWEDTLTSGEVTVPSLSAGKYIVKQETEFSGYEAKEDTIFKVDDNNISVIVANQPISGYIKINAVQSKTSIPLEGLEVQIVSSGTTVETLKTNAEGTATSNKVPTGKYTLRVVTLPDGYELKSEKDLVSEESVQYQKTTDVTWGLVKKNYKLNVYTREQKGYEKFSSKEVPFESGMCNLNGCVFQILAGEDIKGSTVKYAAGDVIAEFPETATKNATATSYVLIPGKYIIHEEISSPGYKPAEDVEIEVIMGKEEYDIPVLKEPITKEITLQKLYSDGEPQPDAEFYVYSSKFGSYKGAKNGYKFSISTDDNGIASIVLPYGEWKVQQVGKKVQDKLEDDLIINVSVPGSEDIIIGGTKAYPIDTVNVINSDGSIIDGESVYQLFDAEGNPVNVRLNEEGNQFEINGSGNIPVTLPAGEYVIKEEKTPYGYEKAEDIAFAVSGNESVINVDIPHTSKKKTMALSAVIPVWGEKTNTYKDEDENTVCAYEKEYSKVAGVRIVGMEDFMTKSFDLVTDSNGSVITIPLEVKTYYILVGNVPDGYYVEENPVEIVITDDDDKTITKEIVLKQKPSMIKFYPYEQTTGEKNNMQYGLFALKTEDSLQEGSLPISIKKAQNGFIFFVGEFPSGNYAIAPISELDGEVNYNAVTKVYMSTPGSCAVAKEENNELFTVDIEAVDASTKESLSDAYVVLSNDREEIYKGYIDKTNRTFELKPGKYYLQALLSPEKYAKNMNVYTFTLENDGSVTGTNYIPLKPNKISIKENNENGEGVEGATIVMRNTTNGDSFRSITDTEGRAVFEGVTFGKYEISECFPAAGYHASNTIIQLEVDGGYQNISEDAATLTTEMNSLECAVCSTDGSPIRNAEIELQNNYGSIVQSVVTDENGLAYFTAIPYGSFVVRVKSVQSDYLPSNHEYPLIVSDKTKGHIVEKYVFVCVPKNIEYRLIMGDGTPVYGAEFVLVEKDTASVVERVKTGIDGRFAFKNYDFGEYLVRQAYAPEGTARIDDIEITINENWKPVNEQTLKTTYNYFEMLSCDNKGNPLPNVLFAITNLNTEEKFNVVSDENGLVRFNNLRLADYEITQTGVPSGYEYSKETLTIRLTEYYKPTETLYRFITRVQE